MIDNEVGTVTLSKKEYETLIKNEEKLSALEAGGVDNWEWYSESLEPWLRKWYPEDYDDEDTNED